MTLPTGPPPISLVFQAASRLYDRLPHLFCGGWAWISFGNDPVYYPWRQGKRKRGQIDPILGPAEA